MTASPIMQALEYAARTDPGKVRENNEDNLLLEAWSDGSALLAVVADGMGGHQGGEAASRIVVEAFRELLDQSLPEDQHERYEMLMNRFGAADTAILEKASTEFELRSMGSTVVTAILSPQECLHLYAGDCRLCHFRDGECIYKTNDHSVVRVLVETGRITEDEIPTHPMRSVVTSCLGGGQDSQLSVDPKWDNSPCVDGATPTSDQSALLNVQAGDVILLCSDGLCSELDTDHVQRLVEQYATDTDALAEACVRSALDAGGNDNITVIAIRIKEQPQQTEIEKNKAGVV